MARFPGLEKRILSRSTDKARVGLLLGMGAIAGAHFYRKFEESFVGVPDHQHPTVFGYSNPTQPRLPEDGSLPVDLPPAMLESMDFFRRNEVDFILAPCNTLMFYREKLELYSSIPIVDIINEVVAAIGRRFPRVRRIGLMSTADTSKWGLYHRAIRTLPGHPEIVELDEAGQAETAQVIEDVRLGLHTRSQSPRARTIEVAKSLVSQGAEVIIEGCTEIPCALDCEEVFDVPVIDSSLVLAQSGAQWVQRIERSNASKHQRLA